MSSKGVRRNDRIPRGPTMVRRPGSLEIGMDLTSVAPPDQNFEADAILLTERRGSVIFHCEQVRGGSAHVAIEIRMAVEAFLQLCSTVLQDDFARAFWPYVQQLDALREGVLLPPKDVSAVPTAAVRAQVAMVSHVGSDAEISFYAFSILSLASLSKLDAPAPSVRGVVRITCHTLVLAEALTSALELGKRLHLAKDAPERERGRE